MKVDKKAVGRKIQEYRINEGYTLREFGEYFGTSDSIVSRWEKGVSLPNKHRLYKLSLFIGISVAELLATQPEETRSGYISSNWQPTDDYISWVMGN